MAHVEKVQELLANNVINQAGEKVNFELKEGRVIGLYFSAHWCPPCRSFTPSLGDWYKKVKANGKDLEVVFMTCDRDEASFKDYFSSMPFLAGEYDAKEVRDSLASAFEVRGIPCLVLLDGKSLEVITKEGRGIVGNDAEGEKFPWKQ